MAPVGVGRMICKGLYQVILQLFWLPTCSRIHPLTTKSRAEWPYSADVTFPRCCQLCRDQKVSLT